MKDLVVIVLFFLVIAINLVIGYFYIIVKVA